MITGSFLGEGEVQLQTYAWHAERSRARVLVVHGLGEHAGRYEPVARALVGRRLSVMSYDQRGHGHSEGKRGHVARFEHYVDDLARARGVAEAELPGTGPAYLYGHSMGALVLLRYLQSEPPRPPGAVLSAPWLETAIDVPAWKSALAACLRRLAPAFPVRTPSDPKALTSVVSLQRAYLDDPLIVRGISVRLWDEARAAQTEALAFQAPWRVPTLVLVPMDDAVADAGRTVAWAESVGPPLELVRLPDTLHEPHNDQGRELVFKLVGDWLVDRTRQGSSG